MKGNILAVYFFVAKPDMRVSLHGERVEICHLEGPCPILFSFVAHTEEVRVLFLAISFTAIYAPMSLSSAHFLSTRGIFSYFYCAAGQCGSPRMLHCWHFWLIRLSFPQFLPGNSHGNSPASKLCRHQEFIVLLLFRAVYPPWSPAGEEPSLAISAMAGISSAATWAFAGQPRSGRSAVLKEGLGWRSTDCLPHQDLLVWYVSCTALPAARGRQVEEEQAM